MSAQHVSVAIIGAGPAGASCANSLLIHGAKDVALVDKERFPRDKACGDGIGPGAVSVMKTLGLGEKLNAHPAIKYLAVSGPSGVRARGPLPPVGGSVPIGYTIPRVVFDNYIAASAIARGALDFTGYQLEDAVFENERWTLQLKSRAGDKLSLTSTVLIGADGARSRVRRTLGVPLNSDRHTGTAVRIYAEAPNANFDALQIDFARELLPGYGWLFPISKTSANIGIGIDLENYKKQDKHLEELLRLYQQTLNASISYNPDSYAAYILPYGSEMPRLVYPAKRAALIGDAGSMINPLTGEGIFYGMFAGELIGRLVAPTLSSGSLVKIDGALLDFQSGFSRRFKQHFRLNWLMKEKVEIPRWCDMVINACNKDRVVLSDLIDLMMGDKTDPGIGTLFRIFARNFLPFLP